MKNHKKFNLLNSKPGNDFIEWNEIMSKNFDHKLYYENLFTVTSWIEKSRLKIIADLTSTYTNKLDNPSVLEVGCGDGYVLKEIAKKVETDNLLGIDINKTWLEDAKTRLNDKAKLMYGFAEDLPFEDNSMDLVICTEVIEHVIDPEIVFKELKRVVKPNHHIIVSIPNENLINRLKDILTNLKLYNKLMPHVKKDNEWHLHDFDLNLLKKYIKDDFQFKSILRLPFLFLPIRYIVVLRK